MIKRRKKQGNTPADSRQRAGTLVEDYNKLANEFRILQKETEKLREALRDLRKCTVTRNVSDELDHRICLLGCE